MSPSPAEQPSTSSATAVEPALPGTPPPMAGNVVRRLVGTTVRLMIAFVAVPVFTRLLGMSQWGLLALFQAAAAPLALLDLGTTPALVKLVSEAHGRNDDAGAARYVRAALLFNAALLAAGATALVVLAPWFARSYFAIPAADVAVATRGFRLVALSWASGAALTFFSTVLAARQRYDEVLRSTTLAGVASTSAGLTAAALTRDPSWVLLGQALGTCAVAVFTSVRVYRLFPQFRGMSGEIRELRRLLSFGAWQTTAQVGVVLATWSDRYVLGAFFAPSVVGFYALAQSLYQQLYATFFEAGEVLFPAVSHRQGMGDMAGARRLSLLAGWTLTTAFGPAAVTLAVVGGDFIRLWISPEAADAATLVLRLLCAGAIASMAGVAPILFAMGSGRPGLPAPLTLIVGLVSAGSAYVLVPRFGLAGVGLASLAANAVRWVFVLALGRVLFHHEGFTARSYAIHVFAPPLASLSILVLFGTAHDAIAHAPGWGRFVAEALAVFLGAAAVQLGIGELLPGGTARRRDVLESFRPVAIGLLARVRGR